MGGCSRSLRMSTNRTLSLTIMPAQGKKTKIKKRAQTAEGMKQHRMAQSQGKKQNKREKGKKKIKPKHKGKN